MVAGLEANVTNTEFLNIAVVLEERRKGLEILHGFAGPPRSNLVWRELLRKMSKVAAFFLWN